MANSTTILSKIDNIIVSNGVGNINADNFRCIAELLLYMDIRATGTITADSDSPSNGSTSGDFFVRRLYDMNNISSIDYNNRRLYRMGGSYFDWEDGGSVGTGTVTRIEINAITSQIDSNGSTPTSFPINITSTGQIVINIKDKGISYDLIQNVAGGKLLGRYDSSPGAPQEVSLDSSIGYSTGIDILGNTFHSLNAVNTYADVVIKFSSMRADIIMASAGYLIASGHGNFVVKRVAYVVQNTPTNAGGASSLGEFNIVWSESELSTVDVMKIRVVAYTGTIQWRDASDIASPTASQIIPSGTTIHAKNVVASSGWSTTTYDVYVIGFYELP